MKHAAQTGLIACLTALWAGGASASTDEAWAELRETLVQTCTDLARDGTDAPVTVQPNEVGSARYAVARVTDDQTGEEAICIMEKGSGDTELTVPFAPEQGRAQDARP